jgi:hypothetical protein
MRYLITGHPRTRSAWLCALMNAHGSLCYHDALSCQIDPDVDAGIADPTFACFFPDMALAYSCPRVCILRDDWREAIEQWSGVGVSDEAAEASSVNCDRFARTLGTLSISLASLEDNGQVKEIVELCTSKPASLEIIQIFQGLKIEQHPEKYRSAFAISQSA